jgi:hypothetical protein
MKISFAWGSSRNRTAGGQYLTGNGILLGCYMWCSGSHEQDEPYKIISHLPSPKPQKDKFATVEEAKKALEDFVTEWLGRFV